MARLCQLHTPHGGVWGLYMAISIVCCAGLHVWAIKPVSLGPQIHGRLTLHSGVSAAPRDLHRLPLVDLVGSRLASPCTPQ